MHEHEPTDEQVTWLRLFVLALLFPFRWLGRSVLRAIYPIAYGEPYDK